VREAGEDKPAAIQIEAAAALAAISLSVREDGLQKGKEIPQAQPNNTTVPIATTMAHAARVNPDRDKPRRSHLPNFANFNALVVYSARSAPSIGTNVAI
jgi:acyl-CoA thioesterase